tara:strand:+ start:47 stop:232 length:186 start_codon:yes stop_codon:yes gene_type:complete
MLGRWAFISDNATISPSQKWEGGTDLTAQENNGFVNNWVFRVRLESTKKDFLWSMMATPDP